MHIVAVIHKEDGVCGISYPDFPGCISAAESREDVLTNAVEAMAGHLECLAEQGEQLPELRTEADLRRDPGFSDDFADASEVVLLPLPIIEPTPTRAALPAR